MEPKAVGTPMTIGSAALAGDAGPARKTMETARINDTRHKDDFTFMALLLFYLRFG
jgi:hypothetical protein